jgi:aminoglycoside/choline kinase family phosphotransferase
MFSPRHGAQARGAGLFLGELEAELRSLVERQLGVAVTGIEPIAAGIGLRRFFRIATDGAPHSVVARVDAAEDPAGRPPGIPPEPPVEPLRRFLESAGLPVPARLGGDPARGIELHEDLGAQSLADLVPGLGEAERVRVYRDVLAWIPKLQRLSDPGALPAFERRLDRAHLRYKGDLFATWSLPLALGRAATAAETDAVRAAFLHVALLLDRAPLRLAHRDLQSRNVQVRAGAPPRLAMIDFQGAFLAPPEYDAVALLRDSYVELPDAEVAAHVAWLRPQLPDAPDADTFQRRFDLLTVTRKGKDHARFVYAWRERGDARYLDHLPTTARALRAAGARLAAGDGALAPLAEALERLPDVPCAP